MIKIDEKAKYVYGGPIHSVGRAARPARYDGWFEPNELMGSLAAAIGAIAIKNGREILKVMIS